MYIIDAISTLWKKTAKADMLNWFLGLSPIYSTLDLNENQCLQLVLLDKKKTLMGMYLI